MASRVYVGVLMLALLAGTAMAGSVEKMGIWVPLYVVPGAPGAKDEYNKLIDALEASTCSIDSFHGTVLTGFGSGPPTPDLHDFFDNRFSVVTNTKQWYGFGYVSTNYGNRSLDAVITDIKTWLDTDPKTGFNQHVQGIWVDGVPSKFSATNMKYYKLIVDTINSYGKMVALNPGVQFQECDFIEKNQIAFLNNYEDTYAKFSASKPAECKCKGKTRCMASIHSMPVELGKDGAPLNPDKVTSQLKEIMGRMGPQGYNAIFFTDRVMPDHYLQLPSIWPQVLAAACATTIENQVNTALSGVGRKMLSSA